MHDPRDLTAKRGILVRLPFSRHETEHSRLADALAALLASLESPHSRRGYAEDWRRFEAFCRRHGIAPIEARTLDVVHFLEEMKDSGKAHATRKRSLASLRAVYGAVVQADLRRDNPAREVRLRGGGGGSKTPYLTLEELERLMAGFGSDWRGRRSRLLTLVAGFTGLRRSSIAGLFGEDLRPGNLLFVRTVKRGKQAQIKIPEGLACELREWMAYARLDPTDPMFPARELATPRKPISPGTIAQVIKEAAVVAGIDPRRVTPHSLRRTYATELEKHDVDPRKIQRALLHADLSTTEKYIKELRPMLEAPGEILWEKVFGKKS